MSPQDIAISGKYVYVISRGGNGYLEVIDISGIDSPSANIGSLQTDQLTATKAVFANDLSVGAGLSVSGNTRFDGDLSVNSVVGFIPKNFIPSFAIEGATYYDNDTSELCFYNSTAWKGVFSGGACS